VSAVVYSRWDGSQEAFSLDAQQALDALSELMMEGMSAASGPWKRSPRCSVNSSRARMRSSSSSSSRNSSPASSREQDALRDRHGYESARMNDFQERRHADTSRLSEAIDQFRDYRFEDEEAGDEFRELLEELDRMRALEEFTEQRGERFHGPEAADASRPSSSWPAIWRRGTSSRSRPRTSRTCSGRMRRARW
jgi:hypothetical protein